MNLINIRNIFLIGVVLNIILLHVTNCCSSSGIEIEAPQTTITTLNNGTGGVQKICTIKTNNVFSLKIVLI